MDVARAAGNKGSPDRNITGYASLGNWHWTFFLPE